MTKEQLVELVQLRLGDKKRFGQRTIAKNLALAWNTVMSAIIRQNPQGLDRYTRKYECSIEQDATTESYYISLPEGTVQVPEIGNGIRNISAKKDTTIEFIPMSFTMAQTMKHLDVEYVNDKIGYFIKNNRIEFYNNFPEELYDDSESLFVDAVLGFDYWDDDDNIDLPMGSAESIVGLAVQFLEGTPYVPLFKRRFNLEEELNQLALRANEATD